MSKINIEDIRREVEEQNWVLVSEEYKNLDIELEFRCPEGHNVHSPWKKMRNGLLCPRCEKNRFKNIENKLVAKKNGIHRLLALDQASHTTGFSIYDDKNLIHYGIYNAPDGEDIERFDAVKNWLESMIVNWKPDIIALEGIQYQQNFGVTTFESLARLQGILMECCFENKIQFIICPTNTWRHHCGVKGTARADRKRSMQLLIKEWFDVSVTDDIADAIGIGKYASDISAKPEVVSWE